MTPLLIGLTGGIAAGKSEALAAFERCGAATLSTDQVTHDLLATPAVREQLVERWGPEIAPGGEIDRDRVAAVVFANADELKWLESVIHPLVGQRIADWRCGVPDTAAAAVIEVPLLFESGLERAFDATVAIVADPSQISERAAERGTLAGSKGREDRQLSAEEKAGRADHVIVNDGTIADLEEAIRALLESLGAKQR